MNFINKPLFIIVLTLFSFSIHANSIGNTSGNISAIYVDQDETWTAIINKSDIVFVIEGQPGPCGSGLYHIQRSNRNFKEFYSIILAAFLTGKSVNVTITSCGSDRNIVSKGVIY